MDLRRKLDELFAIYSLEPALRDIYVEGTADKSFVEWFLHKSGRANVTVYPINLIEIPDDIIQGHGLPVGSHRSAVIALAAELEARCPDVLNVLCVADRDSEDYVPAAPASEYLLLTECNSLELYGFTPESVRKFLLVGLGGFAISAERLIEILTAVVSRVYALRLANEMLHWRMEWLSVRKYVKVKGQEIEFNEQRFIRAYLQKNNRWHERDAFAGKVREVRGILSSDTRRRMRGHDVSELLLVVLRAKRRERAIRNAETLEGCLLAASEYQDLKGLGFFQRILTVTDGQ